MTTKAKGLTLPDQTATDLAVKSVKVTDTAGSLKLTSVGLLQAVARALSSAIPKTLKLQAQSVSLDVTGNGADVIVEPGLGANGGVDGNLVVKNSDGLGGGYNTPHIVLGSNHLWLDTDGKLRLAATPPLNSTDGIVINSITTVNSFYSYTPPNLADGTGVTVDIPTTGAVVGDSVIISYDRDLQGVLLTGYVSAPAIVTVRFQNETGGALTLLAGLVRIKILK